MELLDCALIHVGACVVIRSNMVIFLFFKRRVLHVFPFLCLFEFFFFFFRFLGAHLLKKAAILVYIT